MRFRQLSVLLRFRRVFPSPHIVTQVTELGFPLRYKTHVFAGHAQYHRHPGRLSYPADQTQATKLIFNGCGFWLEQAKRPATANVSSAEAQPALAKGAHHPGVQSQRDNLPIGFIATNEIGLGGKARFVSTSRHGYEKLAIGNNVSSPQ
jgi:hypothetical protein